MTEKWRVFEGIVDRFLGLLNGGGEPLTLQETSDIQTTAHEADVMVADIGTTLAMGGVEVEGVADEMSRLLNDPEIVRIYNEELWPEWFRNHETIDGVQTWALRAEAGRISQERRLAALEEEPPSILGESDE